MPKHFHTSTQASNFKNVVKKLLKSGAEKVGLTGSRSTGIKKDGSAFDEDSDTDVVAVFPEGHKSETQHFTIVERKLPDGSAIPSGIQISVVPREGGDVVGIDMKNKARWINKR